MRGLTYCGRGKAGLGSVGIDAELTPVCAASSEVTRSSALMRLRRRVSAIRRPKTTQAGVDPRERTAIGALPAKEYARARRLARAATRCRHTGRHVPARSITRSGISATAHVAAPPGAGDRVLSLAEVATDSLGAVDLQVAAQLHVVGDHVLG
jgi:hypothetical protein